MEIELKYSLENEQIAEQIRNDEDLAKYEIKDSEQNLDLFAVYFDTEDMSLSKNFIAYRVRREGARNIATLKWNGMQDGALHKREELNINLGSGDFPKTPDISVFKQSEIGQRMIEIIGDKKIISLMEINMHRQSWRLEDNNAIVEVCIDSGKVITPKGETDICEIEIEMLTGTPEIITGLGDKLSEKYGLKPEKRSKFERGLALLER